MRRISMFLPVLCCLAFVAQQSAARDDAVKDKGKEWVEGSVWVGTVKSRSANGEVSTADVTVVVTKRDGKSFEGRYEFRGGELALEFEGELDSAGKISLTVTKIAMATDEYKKSLAAKNIVGVKGSGAVDGKSVTLKYAQPYADNPKGAPRTGTVKLKLKE
jgi:hypothetical protein